MKRINQLLLIVLPAALLFGCPAKPVKQEGVAVEERGAGLEGGVTQGAGGDGTFAGTELDDPSSPLAKRLIYFEFDSSEVRSEFRFTVSAHARYLSQNPEAAVTLEGHADERGSREYNLALGERRANAVRSLLLAEGAASAQIQTVSYGEEKPVADGHDETAWSQNRRVEIVYTRR
ncbi:MAG: peptidoglycan-associated lipoprotein Pal [Gammaproteobacteria bacterium]|nr:MAG: peptidoglycan-associated lipoprotein Pal [Gammaproteobacteria bacterium]